MAYLVIFEIAGRAFALPAKALHKVVDAVPVTPLPFVGGDVEGMVSAGGSIVAQIDLGRRIGLPPRPDDPSAVMVVRINGRLIALRVAQVLNKTEILEGEIAAPDAAAGPLIAGEFSWQERPVTLLRLDRLGIDDLPPVKIGRPVAILGDLERRQPAPSQAAAASTRTEALVVRCNGEPYALPLGQVQEVMTTDRVTGLPHAPPEILGLTAHRATPLLVLSLARLLGKTEAPSRPRYPVTLIHHDNRRYGLAVDAILGMRRLDNAGLHPLTVPQGGISGYHIAPDQAFTGLIDLGTLLGADDRLLSFLPAAQATDAQPPQVPERERRFLTFLIGAETFGIDIDRVERIAEHRPPLRLPGHQHAALTGMVEIAGRVVPMADLRRPLGRPSTVTRRTALVLARGTRGVWAVVVDRLSRIIKVPVSAIKAASGGSHFIGEIARVDRALMPILDPSALDSLTL